MHAVLATDVLRSKQKQLGREGAALLDTIHPLDGRAASMRRFGSAGGRTSKSWIRADHQPRS